MQALGNLNEVLCEMMRLVNSTERDPDFPSPLNAPYHSAGTNSSPPPILCISFSQYSLKSDLLDLVSCLHFLESNVLAAEHILYF
jgi:hypothetical protein